MTPHPRERSRFLAASRARAHSGDMDDANAARQPPQPVPLYRVGEASPYAYACGHCGFVRVGYDVSRQWSAEDTDSTRREAQRCCACADCGAINPRDARASVLHCAACSRTAEAAQCEANATARIEDAASFDDAERQHNSAFRFAIEGGRTGRAFICDDYGGVFEQAFARLDPIPEDETPKVYHEGLTRSGVGAAMRAVAELCADHDAALASWEVTP